MKNPLVNEIYTKRTYLFEEDIRGAFFRDQTAIVHSTAFRRLKHKTQVFYAPKNDHICTRIEHVLHVATIATTICKGLNAKGWNLDIELAFAIGLGHDLGHAPFGHDGENILNKLMGGNGAFIHEIHSYRVVQHLSNNGKGLNLTYGVKDGIITHNGEKYEQRLKPVNTPNDLDNIKNRQIYPSSYEGCIVRYADKIAYLGRDVEDAIIAGLISTEDIPVKIRNKIGDSNSKIINYFVNDFISSSFDNESVGFSDNAYELLLELRNFNYRYIYLNDKDLLFPYAEKMLTELFFFLQNIFEKFNFDFDNYKNSKLQIVKNFGKSLSDRKILYNSETPKGRIVGDFVAGMTDEYAIEAFKEITFPKYII